MKKSIYSKELLNYLKDEFEKNPKIYGLKADFNFNGMSDEEIRKALKFWKDNKKTSSKLKTTNF